MEDVAPHFAGDRAPGVADRAGDAVAGCADQAPGSAAGGLALFFDILVEDEDVAALDAAAAAVADGVAAAHHDSDGARAFGAADEEMLGAQSGGGLGEEEEAEQGWDQHYTSRLCFTAASIKLANKGWGPFDWTTRCARAPLRTFGFNCISFDPSAAPRPAGFA